jgi:hypothetical protein
MYDDSAHQQQTLLDAGSDEWNIDRVQKELPKVQLKLPDGSIHEDTVYGDGLYAKITWPDKALGWMKPIEVCWDVVVNCLNENRPVIY